MEQDPIVEEVRKIRHEIEAECHKDAQTYFQHLQAWQTNYQGRLVRRPPKKQVKVRMKVG